MQAQTLSIDSILALIEANHPELKKYDYKIGAIKAYAQAAKNWEPPQAAAGFYQTPYNPFGNPNIGFAMFSVQQAIPNPKKQAAKARYMLAGVNIEEANRTGQLHQYINEAKLLYGEWAFLKKKQATIQKTKAIMEYITKAAELRYQINKEDLSNIYKAKAEYYDWESQEITIQNEMEQRQIALNTLMNRNPITDFEIDTVEWTFSPLTTQPDSQYLAQNRSDLKTINQRIQQQKLNLDLEASKRLPDYGVRFDHMLGFGNQANQFTLMGMFTIPIVPWASKEYEANKKGINSEILQAEEEKNAIFNLVEGKLASLRLSIANKKHELEHHQDKIIPALQKAYETALIAYEQNTGDLFKVLEALKAIQTKTIEVWEMKMEMWRLQSAYEREVQQ